MLRLQHELNIRATVRVRLRVYLLCLLCFCQACCCRHLGGKTGTAINL